MKVFGDLFGIGNLNLDNSYEFKLIEEIFKNPQATEEDSVQDKD